MPGPGIQRRLRNESHPQASRGERLRPPPKHSGPATAEGAHQWHAWWQPGTARAPQFRRHSAQAVRATLAAALLLGFQTSAGAQSSLEAANDALRSGDPHSAVVIATGVLEGGGDQRAGALWIRALARERTGDLSGAAEDLATLARSLPENPRVLMALGGAKFKLGDPRGAIEAFDAAAAADPELDPHLWQRGIAHYYAGRFRDGARQFELHRSVNPQDVENSVWHFLCVAATEGLEVARAGLMPVRTDSRVPMAEVLRLFADEAGPDEVFDAAEGSGPGAVFYAHLYVGLYHESVGDEMLAGEHMARAVALRLERNYMWHVARVHETLRNAK